MKEFLGKVWNAIVFTIPILIYLGLLIFSVISVVSSCSEHNEVKHNDPYYEGYSDGYDEGYYDGIGITQESIESLIESDLWFLSHDIEDEYGLHPEDALNVLTNYIDVPDEVDELELVNAIYAIRRYYHKSNEVINNIEDYWID